MLQRLRNKAGKGFTLIELMIVVAIIGILAAVAIPAFIKYIRKSKTVEATEGLDKVKAGASQYFQADHYDTTTGNLLAKFFPQSVGTTPTGTCCTAANGTGSKCTPNAALWNVAGWRELHYQLSDPHYFTWTWTSNGSSNTAAGYTAEATGDLDCDAVLSSYKILGTIDTEYGVQVKGPIVLNEIE